MVVTRVSARKTYASFHLDILSIARSHYVAIENDTTLPTLIVSRAL